MLFEGTHSPGDGIAFTAAGSLAYGPNSDLRIEIIDANVLTPGFDRLVSTGDIILGGDLDLQLVDYVEENLSLTDQLVLLTSSGITGQFVNVAPGERLLFDDGLASAQIDYGPTSPFDPNHIVFSEFVREPERVFWIGGNSIWNSPANWDILRVPNNEGPLKFHAIVNAGNVDVNVPVALSRLTLNNAGGALTLNQTMNVGDFTWNAGDLTGPNVLTITGLSTFDTVENVNTGPGLINQGTTTWVDGDLTGTFNQLGFVNEGEFLIELVEDQNFQYVTNTATGVIRHTGTARAWLGGNTGFENDGLVEITGGGTLRIGRDRTNGSDGDFMIADGRLETNVGFAADHKFNGSVTGQEVLGSAGNASFHGVYDVGSTVVQAGTYTFATPTPAQTDQLTLVSRVAVETELRVGELTWTSGGFFASPGHPILIGPGVIAGPATKTLSTTLINRGELSWNDGTISSAATSAARLRNEGTFNIELATARAIPRLENSSGATVRVLGSQATIHRFDNDGLLEAAGGVVQLSGSVDNHAANTLARGEWIVRDGAAIDFDSKVVAINDATVRLFGANSVFTAINALADNRGLFEIAEGRDFTTPGDLANSGSVVIGAGSTLTVSGVYTQTGAGSSLQVDGEFLSPNGPATFAGGAELGGGGFIPGDIVIGVDGVITPGSSPGTLTVESLHFGDNAVYEWEYDGAESDSIVASSSVTLGSAATLRVVQLGGAPKLSDAFVLFEYPNSQVDPTNPAWTIDGSLAPDWDVSSASVTVDPIANQVLISGLVAVLNPGDFNADGLVDAADYTVWRDSIDQSVAPFTSADGDGDGLVTVADYGIWSANYGATGVSADPAAVPEPCGFVLSLLLALTVALKQSRVAEIAKA